MTAPKRRGRAPPSRRQKRGATVSSNQLTALMKAPTLASHRFRRVFQETISGSAAGIVAYSPLVVLNKMPSFTEFSNLYNEYRFLTVTCLFRPVQSTFSLIGPTSFPVVNSVIDFTDFAPLSSITAAMQYPSWKQNCFSQTRPHIQLVYNPRVLVGGVFSSTGTVAALLPVGAFLTFGASDAQWFGLKTILQDFPAGVDIEVSFLVDFECRGVR